MKKVLCYMLSFALASSPMQVFADETSSDAPAVIVPMKKGQPAPHEGVLLTVTAAASITVELKSVGEKVKIAVDRATEEATVKCDAKVSEAEIKAKTDKDVLQARLDAQLKENKVLNERIKKSEEDRPSAALWIGVGFIGGILTTAGIVALTK